MSIPSAVSDMHARFCSALTHRYFIRVHMTVMLGLVLLSGVLAGRLLWMAGVTNMGFRYPAAVLVSYAAFFGLIRLWLAYVCRADRAGRATAREASSRGSSSASGWTFGGGSGSGGSGSGSSLVGGGGSGGGAGASDAWEGGSPQPMAIMAGPSGDVSSGGESSASSASSSHGLFSRLGGSSSGGGGGGDGDGLLLLILFGVLVAAVCGAGVYVVYQAPVILSDAAFQAVLAGGLAHTARGVHDRSWERSILKATAIPFGLVLVFAAVFGFEAHRLCPGATTVRQVLRTCVMK